MDGEAVAARRLTVAQLLPALEGGGVERGTLEVAAELVRLGHRSIVLSSGGRMVDALQAGGSEHYSWPIGAKSPLSLRLVPRLRRWLREEGVDIVHARSRMPAWIAYLAWHGMAPEHRPRFLTTMHGAHSVNRYSRIMTRGERVIAVSEFIRQHILENYPDTVPEKITVIHRGVDPAAFPFCYQAPERWRQAWFQMYPQLQGKRVITLPGRLTRLKGHHDFIDLIESLAVGGIPVAGLIVGGEDPRRRAYAEEIRQRARALGGELVTFTGQRSDLREIYSVSDLVVSVSRKAESFGRTVAEALSLGVPVMGYDHGGVGEILGAVFPRGRVPLDDIQGLVRAALAILSDEIKMSPLDRFHLQDMLDATLRVYEGMIIPISGVRDGE
ncbi:MAG: glycosyltransferase [Candidatus Sedimenticola endophacoides]